MNEIIKKEIKVYNIRGVEVVLDSDLAFMYNYETKYLNRLVARHKEKFLNNSYFQVTNEEYGYLRCQNVTTSLNNYGGRRYLPYVFTKEGIEVLSTILKTSNKEIITQNILNKFSDGKLNNSMIMTINTEKITDLIYEIRGKQVMLDSDLARLYECKNGTKTINLAVKRHPKRFPERYCFQLTEAELRFQFETANININMIRSLPYVFTEQGVAMLATVLNTGVAEKISLTIMDAFVLMKRYISTDLLEQKYYKNMLLKHDEEIKLLQETFNKFQNKEEINTIFFEWEIYDAYSKIIDIMNKAKKELIIIDRYADKTILDMIKSLKIKVLLITKYKGKLSSLDITKYNEEYDNLEIVYDDSFHDRYLILDKKIVYHCGASLNYAGKRAFSINRLEDKNVINSLILEVSKKIIPKEII